MSRGTTARASCQAPRDTQTPIGGRAAPLIMYLVREVLHCRPGKVGALVEMFKRMGEVMRDKGYEPFRLFTDVSGEQFWTLVLESESASLTEFQSMEADVLSDERARAIMSGYHDLVQNGRREIFKVVE